MRAPAMALSAEELMARAESRRQSSHACLDGDAQSALGQFFTPRPVAELLASMFDVPQSRVRVLDAGAGTGSLTAALVARAAQEGWTPGLDVCAIEIDPALHEALAETLVDCLSADHTDVSAERVQRNFLEWACDRLGSGLFAAPYEPFDMAILNPPYRKLRSDSRERNLLRRTGIDVTNLYAAFVACAIRLLAPNGQLVAITPRSFCNGPYFRQFRKDLLADAGLRRVHVFEARDVAFQDASVLQENVIIHAVAGGKSTEVILSSSRGSGSDEIMKRTLPIGEVIQPNDPEQFIRLVPDENGSEIALRIRALSNDLEDLDLTVSTGRVVDFRVRDKLRDMPGSSDAPLIYPGHIRTGRLHWPYPELKKPNAISRDADTEKMLLPHGTYVAVRRFSTKEERRRVFASVIEASRLPDGPVAFENHLNVFHREGGGLSEDLAWGLSAFLNSSSVDAFVRQFNGHTQVNATDLRSLRYPSRAELEAIGRRTREPVSDQIAIDALVAELIPSLGAGAEANALR